MLGCPLEARSAFHHGRSGRLFRICEDAERRRARAIVIKPDSHQVKKGETIAGGARASARYRRSRAPRGWPTLESASREAASVCSHLPLINAGSGFGRCGHSTAHHHLGSRSRLGFRNRGNFLCHHPSCLALRKTAAAGQPRQPHGDNSICIPANLHRTNVCMPQIEHDSSPTSNVSS